MHSRIFQIDFNPIEESDYIDSSKYDDNGFVGEHADYVADSDNREEDIKWLIVGFENVINKDDLLVEQRLIDYDDIEQSIIFKAGFKEAYFQKKFDELNEFMKSLDLKTFSSDSFLVYKIQKTFEEKHGFYVDLGQEGYMTLDSFIRGYVREDTKYYFGGTVDYHF